VSNEGFVFLLVLGSTLLAGIFAVAHISAYRLTRRRDARRQAAAAREPEFEFGNIASADIVGGIAARNIHARIGHVDRAQA
jgi:cytochrome bd-type quinol oxidase subunit 1